MPVWETLLIYALGTLWYGLFNWFWFWIWREQPLRESLSLLYRELADYCEAKYSLLTQHTDPEKALPPLLVRQQKAVDLITQCYQQMHMLSAQNNTDYKRMLRIFQEALDLQDIFRSVCISRKRCKSWSSVAMRKKLSAGMRNRRRSPARAGDDILYHRLPTRFTMEKQIGALEKIARQHPDNPVGQFCHWHFSRIARVLRTRKPLYARDLLADKQRRMPLLPALKVLVAKVSGATQCRTTQCDVKRCQPDGHRAASAEVVLDLMTVLLVTQNGYGATRLRIVVNRLVEPWSG
ncbi:FUSC family membrane protein [Escherichia coli]